MKLNEVEENLNVIRKDKSHWNMFKCDDGKNEDLRYAITLALQYDRQEEDYELIKFLFEAEVNWHKISPHQGIGEAYRPLSFLLANYKKVENAFLFESAKYANFDTACGCDALFAFSAGVKKTWEYVEQFDLNDGNPIFYEEREQYAELTESDVDSFLENQKEEYPDNRTEVDLVTLLFEARAVENNDETNKLYKQLERTLDPKKLFELARSIQNDEKAIHYGELCLHSDLLPQKSVSISLMEIYSKNGNYKKSLEQADYIFYYAQELHDQNDAFEKTVICERFLRICSSMLEKSEFEYAKKIFHFAHTIFNNIKQVSLSLAELAYGCASKLQDSELLFYESICKKEKKESEDLMELLLQQRKMALD